MENTWGSDWGENGYARILGKGESQIDMYAIGMAALPYTLHDYYSMQNMANVVGEMQGEAEDEQDQVTSE